jgi:DNA replication protein DnaC
LDETIHYRRRSFCPCAAGQHLAQQQAQADKESEWIDQVNALIDNAGLNTGIYARFRFDKWDRDRQGQSSTKVYDLVMDYTNEVTQNGANWLYIHGDYGCGKTHLAVAAIKRCIANQGWTGRMTVWPELCQMTKETWGSNHGPSEAQLWNRVRTARILLIDDLDKTGTGEWAMGKLYALINHRLTKGLPTIITANDSLAELRSEWENSTRQHVHDLGLAVLSRIAEALWGGVKIEGDDQRWMR